MPACLPAVYNASMPVHAQMCQVLQAYFCVQAYGRPTHHCQAIQAQCNNASNLQQRRLAQYVTKLLSQNLRCAWQNVLVTMHAA